jgi:hypothetical protein
MCRHLACLGPPETLRSLIIDPPHGLYRQAWAASLPAVSLLGLEARVDSALLWALVRHRLQAGQGPGGALAGTAGALRAAGVTGRFNFPLTDGRVIAARTPRTEGSRSVDLHRPPAAAWLPRGIAAR